VPKGGGELRRGTDPMAWKKGKENKKGQRPPSNGTSKTRRRGRNSITIPSRKHVKSKGGGRCKKRNHKMGWELKFYAGRGRDCKGQVLYSNKVLTEGRNGGENR